MAATGSTALSYVLDLSITSSADAKSRIGQFLSANFDATWVSTNLSAIQDAWDGAPATWLNSGNITAIVLSADDVANKWNYQIQVSPGTYVS